MFKFFLPCRNQDLLYVKEKEGERERERGREGEREKGNKKRRLDFCFVLKTDLISFFCFSSLLSVLISSTHTHNLSPSLFLVQKVCDTLTHTHTHTHLLSFTIYYFRLTKASSIDAFIGQLEENIT